MKNALRKQILNRWLECYSGIFYKVVRAYSQTHHDQEDLFQEIVVQVWRAIPRFKGKAKESTFLYQVALFAAMAWSRNEKRRREDPHEMRESDRPLFMSADDGGNPRLEWLYDRISELDTTDRSLALLMLDGLSYREMAEVLGISESNVGVKLTRIRKNIAKLLEKEDGL